MNCPRPFVLSWILAVSFGLVVPQSVLAWGQAIPVPTESPETRAVRFRIESGAAQPEMKFDSVSVKPHTAHDVSRLPLSVHFSSSRDSGQAAGSVLVSSTNSLLAYIYFAYNLRSYRYFEARPQLSALTAQLFDIQARATANPTTEQLRLMVQSLLADRFKLKLRQELRQEPVLELVLDREITLVPRIQPHSDDVPCQQASADEPAYIPAPQTTFPASCGVFQQWSKDGRAYLGGRNFTIEEIAEEFGTVLNRQIIDRTGYAGKYDVVVNWAAAPNSTAPSSTATPAATPATDWKPPTISLAAFQDVLDSQLGMKLVPKKEPVEVVVIDRLDPPSAK